MDDAALRTQLVNLLASKDAHATFDAAVEAVPFKTAALVPRLWQYSIWQLVEHIRIAQADILDFTVNPGYEEHLKWPADFWPKARATARACRAPSLARTARAGHGPA